MCQTSDFCFKDAPAGCVCVCVCLQQMRSRSGSTDVAFSRKRSGRSIGIRLFYLTKNRRRRKSRRNYLVHVPLSVAVLLELCLISPIQQDEEEGKELMTDANPS